MIEITAKPLDPDQTTAKVRQDTNGAVVTFLGTTRLFSEGKRVVKLEYEAYEEMALKKLVVAAAAPHRREAFFACHKTVDRVKEIVPIWKKEVFEDGSRWVACENHEFASDEAATIHADHN